MTTYTPATEQECAEIIRSMNAETVRIEGGGTRLPLCGLASITSRFMTGITRHQPSDRTISARSGTTLAEIERHLRAADQRLAFEPTGAHAASTIGAVAAMNLSGSRRPFAGAARDALLGTRFVTGLGELITTGSGALKNVAGLDLTKIIAGSRGSLGLVTEVVFKVTPRPEAAETLAFSGLAAREFPEFAVRALLCGAPITGAVHLSASTAENMSLACKPVALLRLEGSQIAVTVGAAEIGGGVSKLPSYQAAALWKSISDGTCLNRAAVQWRVSLPPARGGVLATSLTSLGAKTVIDWRGGLIWAAHEDLNAVPKILALLDGTPGATARLVRGPGTAAPLRREPTGISQMTARLRQALDPKGLFDTRHLNFGVRV